MKQLPDEMKDWYFPFNWKTSAAWELDGTIERHKLADLKWHLEFPFWSSEQDKGMTFDLKPNDVLRNPTAHKYHYQRILNSDVIYPLCLTNYKNNEIIIDGIHRLAKLTLQHEESVTVKVITERLFKSITIDA